MNVPAICDRVIKWGLVSLIVFTPLAFGTVEPWSIAIMEWGIVTLLLVYGLRRIWKGPVPAHKRPPATGLAWPLGLFMLFVLLQTVPMPLSWLQTISPGSARLYSDPGFRERALQELGARGMEAPADDPLLGLEFPSRRPISVNPGETRARLRLLLTFTGLFFMVAAWAKSGERVVHILSAVMVTGFVVSVLGLLQYLTWNGKIYWLRSVPPASVFGPFVNHNHFAGYVEMIIPVAVAMTFYLAERGRRPPRPEGGPAADERIVPADRGMPGRLGKGGMVLFTAILLVVALFFSLSRGGILSALISGAIFFILAWRRIGVQMVKRVVVLALPLMVVGLIGWIGSEKVTLQLGSYRGLGHEASFRLRVMVWKTAAHNLSDFLWSGAGLGAFEDSFAASTPPGSAKRWDKAHNDYLQVLWETGVVGATLVALACGIFIRRFWWTAIRGREHALDLFRLGLAVSLMGIALHSIIEFNLQIGANGFLFALLAGLLVALHRLVDGSEARRPMLVRDGA